MSSRSDNQIEDLRDRAAPIEIKPAEFRTLGHQLVDLIAEYFKELPAKPVNTSAAPSQVRSLLPDGGLPFEGVRPDSLLTETAALLFDHSLFNGHPRFWGYITSSAAPIGALADLLAAAINPNVGAWILSPVATEIEAQTIRWIAELMGYDPECGGLLVSGGNVANFVGFLAARQAKLNWNIRKEGMANSGAGQPRVYCSADTHTWIEKAADHFGIGTDAIRWIPTEENRQISLTSLRQQIDVDKDNGDIPFLVVGAAGTVGYGVVDPLPELASICKEYNLWFHVDGAYGGLAACSPLVPKEMHGLREADSIATDPHKWLYAPLEAGCALVRNQQLLIDAFSYHPSYYKFDEVAQEIPINYLDFGLQNSRGFRALKVWMGLRQVGKDGYVKMISDDIRLAQHLYDLLDLHESFQPFSQNLSITTFRFVPPDLVSGSAEVERYLNHLNEELLVRLQSSGKLFLSNAVSEETYLLRACIVNFRTSLADIEALPEIVCRIGGEVDAALRAVAGIIEP